MYSAEELMKQAAQARRRAYAPYSHYLVGACLLSRDGRLFLGCNIENAAYGPSICAERVALFGAVAQGCRDFAAIAIVGGPRNCPEEQLPSAYPCGVCRQVLAEFCPPELPVYCGRPGAIESFTLGELLPKSFGL